MDTRQGCRGVGGPAVSRSQVYLTTPNGFGSAATKIRRFSVIQTQVGTDINYVDSPVNGATFSILSSGVYSIEYIDRGTINNTIGVSVNSSQLTTNIQSISAANILGFISVPVSGTDAAPPTIVTYLNAGDVVRPHTDGGATGSNAFNYFRITKIS